MHRLRSRVEAPQERQCERGSTIDSSSGSRTMQTLSRLPIGKNRRVCSVVNATTVPIVIVALPWAIVKPANQ